jgi:phosphoribosyl-ATP pyrophosphohydrolase
MLHNLFQIVKDRKMNPVVGSYTNQLLEDGIQRIAQKIGEEAVEVIIAAVNQGRQRVIEESADLLYHLLVLLVEMDIDLEEVEAELEHRHRGSS